MANLNHKRGFILAKDRVRDLDLALNLSTLRAMLNLIESVREEFK